MPHKKAVILLSGGIDSQTCLAIAKAEGYECYALAIDYGQKHSIELEHAELIAKSIGVEEFRRVKVELGAMPGAALTDENEPLPIYDGQKTIKATYFPARNTIFLSLALAWSEVVGTKTIFFGANLDDYHGFPDTRPEYFSAFTDMANLATRAGVQTQESFEIKTPLIQLDKKSTIQLGLKIGVDYSLSVTCYQATQEKKACGYCDSCTIRQKAFSQLGIQDPSLIKIS